MLQQFPKKEATPSVNAYGVATFPKGEGYSHIAPLQGGLIQKNDDTAQKQELRT